MNEMKVWNFENSNVRTLTIDNEPYFAGKDVAAVLGYERETKAVVDRVDEEDRRMIDGRTQSQFGIELGQRGGWIVNESGLYSLILGSKLPSAKRFKLLYQKYAERGYTSTKTHTYPGNDGAVHSKVHTYWTQQGRLFLYDTLKADNILPVMERESA